MQEWMMCEEQKLLYSKGLYELIGTQVVLSCIYTKWDQNMSSLRVLFKFNFNIRIIVYIPVNINVVVHK